DASSEISPEDYFLDLGRSDGIDAPLVAFQDSDEAEIDEFDAARVRNMPFTFSEQATNSFFSILVLARTTTRAMVTIAPLDRGGSNANIVDSLQAMGFRSVLPPERRVTTLRRGSLGALVNVWELDLHGATIALGGDDRVELNVVIDQLLGRF